MENSLSEEHKLLLEIIKKHNEMSHEVSELIEHINWRDRKIDEICKILNIGNE